MDQIQYHWDRMTRATSVEEAASEHGKAHRLLSDTVMEWMALGCHDDAESERMVIRRLNKRFAETVANL